MKQKKLWPKIKNNIIIDEHQNNYKEISEEKNAETRVYSDYFISY